jgi:mannose-6-phosphate isomerase-like protein (cupin superfamily)
MKKYGLLATVVLAAITLIGFSGLQPAQAKQPGQAPQAPAQTKTAKPGNSGDDEGAGAMEAPTDKAAYFAHGDLAKIWEQLEADQVNNHRVLNGPTYNVNIRIVHPNSPPLAHELAADVWICVAGTATAITGGKLINPRVRNSHALTGNNITGTGIEGGTSQEMSAGDILFIPPGVPHTFENMKGFRAYLIAFNAKSADAPKADAPK